LGEFLWTLDGFEDVGGWVFLVEFCVDFYRLVCVVEFNIVEWFDGCGVGFLCAKGDSPFLSFSNSSQPYNNAIFKAYLYINVQEVRETTTTQQIKTKHTIHISPTTTRIIPNNKQYST